MHDAASMSDRQGASKLGHESRGLARLNRLLGGILLQIATPNVFHHQERPFLVQIEIKHPDNTWMVQLREELTLAAEVIDGFLTDRAVTPLDGHVATESGMQGAKHLRLSTTSQLADDHVLAERRRPPFRRGGRRRRLRGRLHAALERLR